MKKIFLLLSILIITSCSKKEGCTDISACNFDSSAEKNDNSCTYAFDYYDCDEVCLIDSDLDGICDDLELFGCTDENACNFDSNATEENNSCTYAEYYYDCEGDCLTEMDECNMCGYSYFDELPYSVSILSGDSCFYNQDLNVIYEVILLNELTYDSPLEVGTQLWFDGRLRSWVAGNYFSGVNAPLDTLPQNFGDLNDLRILYLEKNNIHYMPESFGNLTNLISLFISDNGLTNIIDNIGDLTQLYFLDLGYNQISVLPNSIVNLENLYTLYLFNNLIETIPDGFCDLNLDWDGYDPFGTPYFAIGGNSLCEDVPDCVINSANFEISLEPAYYLFPINMPQDCTEDITNNLKSK